MPGTVRTKAGHEMDKAQYIRITSHEELEAACATIGEFPVTFRVRYASIRELSSTGYQVAFSLEDAKERLTSLLGCGLIKEIAVAKSSL